MTKKICINWTKVISNAGIVFCTTLISTGFNTSASITSAALIAGLALFTELKTESEGLNRTLGVLNRNILVV